MGRIVKLAALLWLAGEIALLVLAVSMLGWPATLALGLATTILGFLLIARAGRETMTALRQSFADGHTGGAAITLDGPLHAIAAILLILPGFLSDLIGLALMARPLRAVLVQSYRPARRARTDTIDLSPEDWQASRADAQGTLPPDWRRPT